MIAIVGGSSSLLKHEHGKFIDGHSMVIRFNDAPVKNFEWHVGRRTDLRFIAYHGANYNLVDEDILLYSYNEKAKLEALEKLHFHNRVMFLDNAFIRRCDNMIGKPYWKWRLMPGRIIIHKKMSTSGLKAIVHALDTKRKVNLFGFNPDDQFHYYEKNRPGYNHTDSHDFKKEREIIRGFEREGKLKIYS